MFGVVILNSGCTLQTLESDVPIVKPANHLVINEVFTLPATHQRTYSWIELHNPTNDSIRTLGWTLTFTTIGIVSRTAVDSVGNPIPFSPTLTFLLPEAAYEVPLPSQLLRGGEFLTLVNNEERLETYTDYGLGNGPKIEAPSLPYRAQLIISPDTTRPDTLLVYSALFQLKASDQIVLKNAQGVAVDVVRYGNYVYSGSGSDPYPNNRSVGPIPEFQSIARFNAYFTGNTAEDFYRTEVDVPLTRPIPHWLSQAYKQ
jgi:hypothetical protein